MKRQTLEQVGLMVVSGLVLYAVFFFGSNFLANRYIDRAAEEALSTELSYYDAAFQGEDVFSADAAETNYDSNFTVNYHYPAVDEPNDNAFFPAYSPAERDVAMYYATHALENGVITKIAIDDAVYYAVLTRQTTPDHDAFVSTPDIWQPLTEDVVLYINVTKVQNLVRSIHLRLLPFVLIALMVMALLGLYSGRRIEDSQSKLKRFFMNASHELKTPLQAIQGYAEGVEKGIIQDPQMAASVILQQSHKMRDLIDELLLISKLESGAYHMQQEPVHIPDLIFDCLYLYQPLADDTGIRLVPDIPDRVPLILGDEVQLSKAFHAVLANALHYAKSMVSIRVRVEQKALTIHIADGGPGISASDRHVIFERFYTGSGSSGSGIGLAMARDILHHSGGQIYTEERKKGGAVFVISLPIKDIGKAI